VVLITAAAVHGRKSRPETMLTMRQVYCRGTKTMQSVLDYTSYLTPFSWFLCIWSTLL